MSVRSNYLSLRKHGDAATAAMATRFLQTHNMLEETTTTQNQFSNFEREPTTHVYLAEEYDFFTDEQTSNV
jgi:hypothetical protein